MTRTTPRSTLFPYTTLFRSLHGDVIMHDQEAGLAIARLNILLNRPPETPIGTLDELREQLRSEEHTSELQSRFDLVCRLLLEKKKTKPHTIHFPSAPELSHS